MYYVQYAEVTAYNVTYNKFIKPIYNKYIVISAYIVKTLHYRTSN